MPPDGQRNRWNQPLRERLFQTGIALKMLDGVVETAGGVALWIVGPWSIIGWVFRITQDEISEQPHDFVATHLRHAASHMSLSGEHFMAAYLFIHGLVKIVVVLALWRKKLWAYPLSLAVFGGFIVYQLYRFTITHAFTLILLSAFDLAVVCLIWLEYRDARRRVVSIPVTT